MEDFEMPSDEQLKAICIDVSNYSMRKCEEAGYPWFVHFLVIGMLADAQETYMAMHNLLGHDAMKRIAEAIDHMETSEMLEEAEQALREGE